MMRDRRKEARIAREEEAKQAAINAEKRVWHSPSLLAWAMIAASSILLFSLSYWQINRLQWKTNLINTIDNYKHERALPILPEDYGLLPDLAFARVALTGEFLHEQEIHLAARYYNSQLGYHILTPFRLEDGRLVLVNRGWVHVDNKAPETRKEGQLEGTQHLIGMIRLDDDRSRFTPENDPQANIWFSRNLRDIIDATDLKLYPAVVDALYDISESNMPIPSDGLVRLRNDHLQYAITWFLIGISGIIIFVTYHYRKRDDT